MAGLPDVQVNDLVTIPAGEIEESFTHASGPGGQHVNKTATKVVLRWNPAETAVLDPEQRERVVANLKRRLTNDGFLIVTSSATRDQARNREDARDKLALIVAGALHVSKKRVATRPSRGAVERRLQDKKRRSQRKRDRGPIDED